MLGPLPGAMKFMNRLPHLPAYCVLGRLGSFVRRARITACVAAPASQPTFPGFGVVVAPRIAPSPVLGTVNLARRAQQESNQ